MNKVNIRKFSIKFLLGFLVANVILIVVGLFINLEQEYMGSNIFLQDANLTNYDTSLEHQVIDVIDIAPGSNVIYNSIYEDYIYEWNNDNDLTFSVDVESAGEYEFALDYCSLQTTVDTITINVLVNEETVADYENIELPTSWTAESTEDSFDIYKNEVQSIQTPFTVFSKIYLYDSLHYASSPLLFDLEAGVNTITIEKNNGELLLGNFYIFSEYEDKSYIEYNNLNNESTVTDELVILEAEDVLFKSSTGILNQAVQETHATPFSTDLNYLNCLSGDSFNQSGYSITYAFEVSQTGNYQISMKYFISQSNSISYANIYLDNLILFDELNNYAFLANSKYQNETLGNDDEYFEFYLTKGTHYLTIELDASSTSSIYYELVDIIDEMGDLYLDIIKMTGGLSDSNRSWDVVKYIPDIQNKLDTWIEQLEAMLELIDDVSKVNSNKQNSLYQQIDNALEKIETLAANPNDLPHKLDVLQTGSNSAVSMLSSSLHTSTFVPITLDKIYVHSSDCKLPKANSNFFMNYFSMAQRVFQSGVIEEDDEDTLTIWVNRSTYHVTLMQQMADTIYYEETGQKVRLSILSDENKLIYANAANTTPDAALGLSQSIPYDYGLRGSLVDLSELSGFNETISVFSPGALTNLVCGDAVYGLPETQDFQVTYYRTDLLDELNIEVPNTYDEIIEIVPELQRYGMNYYLPIAGASGLKSLSSTIPFIYQYGADIYSDDYFSSAIDSSEAITGINMMVDLFNLYSLPLTSQNFYDSFRNGTIPIGIGGFDTYLSLQDAAAELDGKWEMALYPGVMQDDGTVNRSTTAGSTTAVIFNQSDQVDEAWDFIQWWLSTEIQTKYANDLQATYGSTFMWNSANLEAFANLNIDQEYKDIILEQWDYLYNVPQIPATYIIERGISDIWNSAVFDQASVRSEISDMMLVMNNEIERKMIEFGYLDAYGNIIKPYTLLSLEDIIKLQEEGKS